MTFVIFLVERNGGSYYNVIILETGERIECQFVEDIEKAKAEIEENYRSFDKEIIFENASENETVKKALQRWAIRQVFEI